MLHNLIRTLSHHASSALLVVRDEMDLDHVGQALLSRLLPYVVERKRASSWPGTTLLGEEATVFRFALNDSVVDELIRASEGLYGWQQPLLPEDLALLRDDGTTLLGSIAHERDAFLEVSDEEYRGLIAAVPEIGEIIRAQKVR